MDADMQDPPSLLPEMLGILEQGEYDSVATRRVTRKGEPPIRSWFARMFYKIINKISDSDVVDGARDFRLMKAEMKDAIVSMCSTTDSPREYLAGSGSGQNGWNTRMWRELRARRSGTSGSFSNTHWTE